jgi:hypothetical protein
MKECYFDGDDKCSGSLRVRPVWGMNNLWIWVDLTLCDTHYGRLPSWAKGE